MSQCRPFHHSQTLPSPTSEPHPLTQCSFSSPLPSSNSCANASLHSQNSCLKTPCHIPVSFLLQLLTSPQPTTSFLEHIHFLIITLSNITFSIHPNNFTLSNITSLDISQQFHSLSLNTSQEHILT
jgi:hypothetical protein